MTDIDLTAAIEAADYALRADNNAADNDSLDDSWGREAEVAVEAALPHILAQVEAHVKPTREDVARTLDGELGPFLSYNPERFWGQSADAVLALLPGKTEQEVREEVAAEIERGYLGPDFARRPDGSEGPDARAAQAYDEGLEQAARVARGGARS